ncbi:MAG: type II toxin-antitoxin system prevent-host-death family antitoxin [Nitrospirae bacterium]|nr:type II toxin-antitoxin system prevent-host-death family antitoxin [Nitrospirota bacterium]
MSKAIGIRELKTHLSRYVKEAEVGEDVLISDRGRIVAKLSAISPRTDDARLREQLANLAAKGMVILPLAAVNPLSPTERKKFTGTPFSDAVIEDRR